MVAGGPVTETVQDHIPYHWVIAVQCVPAATEIIVFSIGSQHIIDVIVKSLKREKRTFLIAFCRMVKDHVQDHLNSVFMKFPDQTLQFCPFPVILLLRGIAGVWGEKAYRIIAPVIQKLPTVYGTHVPGFIKLKYRHEFYRIDSQLQQIGDFLTDTFKSSRMFHSGAFVTGKSPDMHFIDDTVLQAGYGSLLLRDFPVKVIVDYSGLIKSASCKLFSPLALSCNSLSIGV